MMDRYVTLHRHDQYSLFDGLGSAAVAAKRAAALGQPALALTNHGTVAGLIEHRRACLEAGIKPVLGCELYVVLDLEPRERASHLTVLCESYEGYRNLMRLVTLGNTQRYYVPRVSLDQLLERSEGLIVLSGCPSGFVRRLAVDGRYEEASAVLDRMFGELPLDHFYVEMQQSEQALRTNGFLMTWAYSRDCPMVFTNDAHYVEEADKPIHDLILRMRTEGKGEQEPTYGDGYYLMSRMEAETAVWGTMGLPGETHMLETTVEIAERCQFEIPKSEQYLPALWGERPGVELVGRAWEGFRAAGFNGPRYESQLMREMEVIAHRNLVPYFLIVADIVRDARAKGIRVGPRGSAVGSLLLRCLDVHRVDPIRYGLMFERFMHEEKTSMPDVDLDFQADRRDEVITDVLAKYEGYAMPIATFGRYVAGNLANDLGKALSLEAQDTFRLKKSLEEHRAELRSFLTEAQLRDMVVVEELEEAHPIIVRAISQLYGQVRYAGRHPGGICFMPDKANDRWLAQVIQGKRLVTSYHFRDIEDLGLVKVDILGVDALTAIGDTIRLVRERHDETIDIDSIPLDEQEVYTRYLARGAGDGLFQLEYDGARRICREIEVASFNELVAAISLNRPGVSDQIKPYVEAKRGHATDNEAWRGGLSATYGVIIYQEQVMWLLREAGVSWADCDRFLKSVKAKGSFTIGKSPEELQGDIRWTVVRHLRVTYGWTEEVAVHFVEQLSGYYFNKAHGTSYALMAYQQAWLRLHYPLEFWCATLNAESDDKKLVRLMKAAALSDDVIFLPPHVNGSAGFQVESNALSVGLGTIKGVGEKAAAAIVAGAPYEDLAQFEAKVNRRMVHAGVRRKLEETGAFLFDGYRSHAVDYNRLLRGDEEDEA